VAAAPIETAEDANRFLRDTIDPLKRALSLSRGGDPTAAAPYCLIRALTWSEIDALPPAADSQTRIPPPPAHFRDRCRNLAGQSAWKELLDEVEDRVAEFPFWLDIHRMSDQALGALGPDYAGARGAVRAETVSFLARLPALSELQFSDGMPFADDSTRRWISTELFPTNVDTGAANAISRAQPDSLVDLRENCRSLMREGKQEKAISLVQEAVKTTSAEREKFLAQLELARLCLEAGQLKPALARFEVLDEQIRRFSLEAWEPDLCVETLRLYWEALNQSAQASRQSAPEMTRQADGVFNRLCKLDVVAGLHLTKATRR
jgi:type VI secretion system protein VasJ